MWSKIFLISYISVCHSWVFTDVRSPKFVSENITIEDMPVGGNDTMYRALSAEDYEEIMRQGRLSLIYPGTKWCGAGDVADGFDDLGPAWQADMCCRDHDYCPDTIPAGETKHNLTNEAFYTKLSCECDETFRRCLRDANTQESNKIGVLYFNLIGTQCFRLDYPVNECLKTSGWLRPKCVEYSYDMTEPKKYQWFDVPFY